MLNFLIFIQVFVVGILTFLILIQSNNENGLTGLASHTNISRSILKRTTGGFSQAIIILSTAFIVNSLIIAKINIKYDKKNKAFFDSISQESNSQTSTVQVPKAE